jgi:hypothetical protein
MYRYTVPELLFVPEFHTGTYQFILYPFIFLPYILLHPSFAFAKYNCASKFPFRALNRGGKISLIPQPFCA